ncbi:MAG TPA: FRG domain-containing protein [Nocardioides sp.]|nr:FRG domain-containing protein [Nocardioides sp.]
MAELLGEVANVTVATNHRYVWRGVKNADYTLHSTLARRLAGSGLAVTADSLRAHERDLIRRAQDSRFWAGLAEAELLALLQHAGAATSLLDVTPDPFVGLFFATEPIGDLTPCALIAIRVPGATPSAQAAHTYKGPFADADPDERRSVYERLREELALPDDTTDPLLWEAPFLDDRMRAQRGMFLATTAPVTAVEYGSFDLRLESRLDETTKVSHLIGRDRGRYHRPSVVVFYIPAALRRQVADELDLRFGYRTETIYPDAAGFALANGPTAPLAKR